MAHPTSSRARSAPPAGPTSGSLLLLGLGERLAIAVLLSGVSALGVALALAAA